MSTYQDIQVLRGTSANIVKNKDTVTLADGQPLFNTDKNYLSIGGGRVVTP